MGNFKAANRVFCSEEKPAPSNEATLKALHKKHPEPPTDRRPFCDPKGDLRFEPLQVSTDEVKKALQTFRLGSSGGPDGLTAQHHKDLLAGASDDKLLGSITQLINLMLAESFPPHVNKIIFGSRLIALKKKDGGVRPIAIGYLIRRLAASVQTVTSSREEAKASNQFSWESAFQVAQKLQCMPPDAFYHKCDPIM